MAENPLHQKCCTNFSCQPLLFLALITGIGFPVAASLSQENSVQIEPIEAEPTLSSTSQRTDRPRVFRAVDLPSVDQLVLVLSNATDASGKNSQEVLVFLGRSKNRGWEKIGHVDAQELSLHWRSVAQRQMEQYRQSGLSSDQLDKIHLAIEVSIAQFQRLYHELRTDFLDQPDQKSRLALLASDSRYERLRQLGREGFFRENSLVAKTINKALADSVSKESRE